jgi:hypothetical protein
MVSTGLQWRGNGCWEKCADGIRPWAEPVTESAAEEARAGLAPVNRWFTLAAATEWAIVIVQEMSS